MNKNHKIKQTLTSSVAVGLAAAAGIMQIGTFPVKAADNNKSGNAEAVYKEETVYVNADASGKTTQVTVSDWLKNAGNRSTVRDESTLEGIKNVKGDETFREDGDSLIWNTQGKDIYYQGTTEQELPVSVKLTWYLDGKEISPDELNGKSGHLEVKIDYENLAEKTVTVDGKQEDVYTPFVMMTGMILPGDSCSNVVIDNGKVISDGSRNIVVGFSMPGMQESLGLDDSDASGLTLPESLTVSADVTDFTVPSTFTAVFSDLLENIEPDKITDMDELKQALDDLEDAALQLVGGTSDLADGADTLSEGVNSYTEGVDQLSSAVSRYLGEDGELNGKVTEYVNGVDSAIAGIREYSAGAAELADGVTDYIYGEEMLADGASKLTDLSTGLEQVQIALDQLAEASDGETENGDGRDLKAAAQSLADGTQKMEDALGSDAVRNLMSQVESMTQTGQTLIDETEKLEEGVQQGIAAPVQNIADQLQNLSGELQKIAQLQENLEEACSRINDTIDKDNARIEDAKQKGASVREKVNESVSALEAEKESLQEENPAAARKIQNVIDALGAAGDSAGALETLENLDEIQPEQLGAASIDTETVARTADAIRENMETFALTAAELEKQLPELQKKIEEIKAASEMLPDTGLEELSGQVDQLNAGMQQLNTAIGGTGGLSENIEALRRSAEESFPEAVSGIDALQSGFAELGVYNDSLLEGASGLKTAGQTLTEGTEKLSGGTRTLLSGLESLGTQMNEGTVLLSKNSGTLRGGAEALKDGAHTLAESMKQFEIQGTDRLKTTVEDRLGSLMDRLKALNSEEAQYDTFSGKDDSMEGNVRFIIETEAGK